jgi:hypothetical protein
MTPPHKLLLAGMTERMEECADALVESLLAEGWDIPGVAGPAEAARITALRLAPALKKSYRLTQNLRLYGLHKAEFPASPESRLRKAEAADREKILAWWYEARLEMMGSADREECRQTADCRLEDGDVYVWDVGEPVSMAVQTRPTRRGISIGMVFTPPAFRRRGYATACVGELSRKLLGEGRAYCALYADLANPASNGIYRKLGYRPIGDFDEYGFHEELEAPPRRPGEAGGKT